MPAWLHAIGATLEPLHGSGEREKDVNTSRYAIHGDILAMPASPCFVGLLALLPESPNVTVDIEPAG